MAENAPTGWERVRRILDAAAGGSTSDYGGVGRPWRLPLAELEKVEVYGVRMIAPAQAAASTAAKGCGCGCVATAERPEGADPAARFPAFPGRGAASGLVR